MRVIARDGPERYLIRLNKVLGQVLDLEQGVLSPPFPLVSIIRMGGWRPYRLSATRLSRLLRKVDPEVDDDDV